MKKIIKRLKEKPEKERRHVLHLLTFIIAIILIIIWLYSLINLNTKEQNPEINKDIEVLKEFIEQMPNYQENNQNLNILKQENDIQEDQYDFSKPNLYENYYENTENQNAENETTENQNTENEIPEEIEQSYD